MAWRQDVDAGVRSPTRFPRQLVPHGVLDSPRVRVATPTPAVGGARMSAPAQWQGRLVRLALAVDVVVVIVTTWPLLVVNLFHTDGRPISLALGIVLPVVWAFALGLGRAYDPQLLGAGAEEFRRVTVSAAGLIVIICVVAFGLRVDVSRGLVVGALPCAVFLDLVSRYGLRKCLHARRRRGECMYRTLLVGPVSWVNDVAARMRHSPHVGMLPEGCCLPPSEAEEEAALTRTSVPVYGGYGEIVAAVRRAGIAVVSVASTEHMETSMLRRLAWELEEHEAKIVVAPNLVDCVGPRIRIKPVDGLPLLEIEQPRFSGMHRVLKSATDRLFALALLLVLTPLLLTLLVLVRITSPGPGLYRQRRVGANGREFWLLKLRTMYADADRRLAEVSDHNDCGDGLLFKLRQDPRVTPLGRRLRRYSLDELPQLVNVLRGEMSVVGPRPPLPSEVSCYDSDVRRRLMVRPGLTGLWQVSGRSDLSWEESVRLDLFYVENWSLALDVMILWKTLPAVLSGKGAY